MIERSSLSRLGEQESILVELADDTQRHMPVVGVAHDLHQWPTPFLGTIYAYITMDTLAWMGEPHEFNTLNAQVAEHADDRQHNEAVAQEIYDKVQDAGLDPSFPQVPTPGEHPLQFIITALTTLMSVLSMMAIVLSSFLVINTIGALLAQQTKQIGVMKAVGARAGQIAVMYIVLVMSFGIIALVPAIPLAWLATGVFTREIAAFLNFDVSNEGMPVSIMLVQAAIGLLIPVLAAVGPVWQGARVTVREALDSSGIAMTYGNGMLDQVLRRVRGLSRPMLLSLRNTFRRKARVALTLITLTLGGAIFVAVFSIRSSLLFTLQDITSRLYNYDAELYLERTYRADYLVSEAERVEGIIAAEAQIQTTVRRVFPDDREGRTMQMFAVPPDTQTMIPDLSAGRWLLPDDENALVVSTGVVNEYPDVQVGSEIMLKIDDRDTRWKVVGIMPAFGEMRWVYASYAYYSRVARQVDQSSYVRIVAAQHTPEYQTAAVNTVEEHYKRRDINVSSTKTMTELSQGDYQVIQALVTSLLFMAILVAAVGGLGLAGTMSLNVIERTREIGIMRAIGASHATVFQIVIVEGIVIGLLSWGLGALLALPISRLLSDSLGILLFSDPLSFNFSVGGLLIWLIISVILSTIASFLPARNATRITVRDVLAHE